MKVLSNQDGQVIIQASIDDFKKLLGEGATYSEVAIVRDGENIDCEIRKLLPGDCFDNESLDSMYMEASQIIDTVKQLKYSCTGIKNQTTKLMNLLNGATPKK